MPCYHPLAAYQAATGDIVFYESARFDIVRSLSLPCGQCIGCRLERSRRWAMRCMHEASLYERNCFVTLTYDQEHLPRRGQLDYAEFQRFFKRLRKFADPCRVRFYMCGEYGPSCGRPHFHSCLFGFDFPDRRHWKITDSGSAIYRSQSLENLWPFGFSSIGDLTFQSAAYVARYCVAKVTGFNSRYHYARVDGDGPYQLVPEFNRMSLKPGIGARWLEKYQSDVFPRDYVIINGVQCRVPDYYDKLLERRFPDEIEDIKAARVAEAKLRYEDNTDERLAVKETVHKARVRDLSRSL